MKLRINLWIWALVILWISAGPSFSQTLETFGFRFTNGLEIVSLRLQDQQELIVTQHVPMFSFEVDGTYYSSIDASVALEGSQIRFMFTNGITGILRSATNGDLGWRGELLIQNTTLDTLVVENLVPFGATENHVYITSRGPWSLTRAMLFRPEKEPVSLVLPDNAWEMGYGAIDLDGQYAVCAISRRTGGDRSELQRYKTVIPPRATVEYTLYADIYRGHWQNGLKKMFQERYLYDVTDFDNTLYDREDLNWIRDKYLITLQFAWDQKFYDSESGKYTVYQFLEEGKRLMGGYDVYGIWPTWPRLGVDQRNQWELYADLPLGLPKLKELSNYAKANGTRFFISYNPWDQSTHEQDPYQSMAALISATDADGVVLDTRGRSSWTLQRAADSVRNGVIMYSEGMAIPGDMPGIVSGRVHNAIFRAPVLNMNKFIKPEFAIFRVVVLNRGPIHRDIAVSFFNGYGTEINTFDPGRPDWMEDEFTYLGKTTKILRENASVFLNKQWIPLIPTLRDSVWVNQWENENKTLYTVLSFQPDGVQGPLFEVEPKAGYHFVSLWNHRELEPVQIGGRWYIPSEIEGYSSVLAGTNQEGHIDCIAQLPERIDVRQKGDSLFLSTTQPGTLCITKGHPTYQNAPVTFTNRQLSLKLSDHFEKGEGRFIIQLIHNGTLIDETIVVVEPGRPYRISTSKNTRAYRRPPVGMKEIPAGHFIFKVANPDQFIPYPDFSEPTEVEMPTYFMDEYPVTNEMFYEFLQASGYRPADPRNFLKHWSNGMYPSGQANYPVVHVSLEDARSYAEWAGKRLPTEKEWQYAAQGEDGRLWPWGNEFHGTKCNNSFGRLTPVDAFSKGESPFKIKDMVGNVWQLTDDVYFNGSYRFVIIRGGSYFNPTSSIWYVKGGPQPLDRTQMLLMVSPGFDRCATVGFRCVADAE
jgi:formylglycine-generating enzyme required for sulfatase activity